MYAIAVVVVILFYLFYFGRLLAGILSLILRTLLWRRFKIWVDVGSVQFSPLGGRLLFRDVRYVGENESINVAMGSITWRYWLWRVRQDDDLRRGPLLDPSCRCRLRLSNFSLQRMPDYHVVHLSSLKVRNGLSIIVTLHSICFWKDWLVVKKALRRKPIVR